MQRGSNNNKNDVNVMDGGEVKIAQPIIVNKVLWNN